MPASLTREPSFGAFMDPESPYNNNYYVYTDPISPVAPVGPLPWTQLFSECMSPLSSPTPEASSPASPADSDASSPPVTPPSTRIADYDAPIIANFDDSNPFYVQPITWTSDLAGDDALLGVPDLSYFSEEPSWAPCGASNELAADHAFSPLALPPADFLDPEPLLSLDGDFSTPGPVVAPDDGLYCSSQMSSWFVDGLSPVSTPRLGSSSPIATTSTIPTEEVPDVPTRSTPSPPPRRAYEEADDDLADGDSEYFPTRRAAHTRRTRRSNTRASPKKTNASRTPKPSRRQRREPEGHRVGSRSSPSSVPAADTLASTAGPSIPSTPPPSIRLAELKYTPSRTNKSSEKAKKDSQLMCPIAGCNAVSTLKADVARHLLSHGKSSFMCVGVPWDARAKYGLADEKEAIKWPDVEGYYVGGCGQTFVRRDALSRHILQSKRSKCVNADFTRRRR